jgi:hypothetical protein
MMDINKILHSADKIEDVISDYTLTSFEQLVLLDFLYVSTIKVLINLGHISDNDVEQLNKKVRKTVISLINKSEKRRVKYGK